MKKKIFILVLMILMLFCSCNQNENVETNSTHQDVTINLPTDDTVNGYRTNPIKTNNDNEKNESKKSNSSSISENTDAFAKDYSYCANVSSKKFHKSTCKLINTMSDKNKYYTNDRNELIEKGFEPCKYCNP